MLLGIDLGTTAVKVGLFTRRGGPVALRRFPYPLLEPLPLWAEQAPDAWWSATVKAIRDVLRRSGVNTGRIAAVGLSGQAPGHVVVDAAGRAIGPAIIWRDRRASRESAMLRRRLSPARARRLFGYAFSVDPTSPASRLLWLARHRPADLKAAAAIIQPKDYLGLKLTGVCVSDATSSFGIAHLRRDTYHSELARLLRVPLRLLPPLRPPHEISGVVTGEAARRTGLRAGTPVAVGTIDAWCSFYGAGAVEDGVAVDVAGTSEVVGIAARRYRNVPGIVGMPLWEDLAFLGGPTQAGGAVLEWISDLLGLEGGSGAIMDLAGQEPPGADGLIFLPYLAGERAPLWDSGARGVFFGLTFDHGPASLARAALEGVGYAVRHLLELCEAATGRRVEEVRVCGGAAVRPWNVIKADITGKTFVELAVRETAALGAAMLAGVGSGIFPDLRAAARAMVRVTGSFPPSRAHHKRYETLYRTYRRLYPRLRPLYPPPDAAARRGLR